MHGALTDAVITCWRLKYDGYWRPFQAINGGDTDDNPATVADPAWRRWSPFAYPDYVSGHTCVASAHMKTLRPCSVRDVTHAVSKNP